MDIVGLLTAAAVIMGARFIFPGYLGYALLCLMLMVLVPAAYLKLRGASLKDNLIGVGDLKGGLGISLMLLAAAMPVMYYGSLQPEFQAYYPEWKPASESLDNFILYEAYMLVIMVSTEFFYRGYLMNLLMRHTRHGNEIHAVVYMLAHMGKPDLETLYSLPVGWLFGKVDIRCRSILPSLIMHYASTVIFDAMILYQAGALPI